MKKILNWVLLGLFSLCIFLLIFRAPVRNYGGDIAEYHGITETIIKSGSLALTPIAEHNLRSYLQPSYFENPGYYLAGTDGQRYPVHFILYSLLAVPVRLVLHLFSINELQTLRITNVLMLFAVIVVAWKFIVQNPFKRTILLMAIFLSPLVFFLSWPGPDIFFLSLLLVSVFIFFQKRYVLSGILAAIAALHSQPLSVLAALIGGYALYQHVLASKKIPKTVQAHFEFVLSLGIIGIILSIPVFYNLLFFGAWSPWPKLQDGWTILNGFGFQNLSFQKFFEQFFDLNFGLFFYAPVLLLTGFYFIFKYFRNKDVIFLFASFLLTAFFYQTNPAWHYGTAGYGPSRHAIFLIPLFIVFFVFTIQKSLKHYVLLGVLILTQLPILYMNGFVNPDITNTLRNSPIAKFVLNNWPGLYNPTPEIFVDRTNHTDLDYPSSAIYTKNGVCKKAYILKTDIDLLKNKCGYIPKKYEKDLDNDFSRKSNISRTTKTIEATFWPDPNSCSAGYKGPYICMRNASEFSKFTQIKLSSRVKDIENGVWRLEKGLPITITVPPGYFIQYYSLEGQYINY